MDEPHQPGGGKAAHAKRRQRASQKIAGHFFRLMRVLLNVGNEIAPGSYLCADIEKLRNHREKEVGIAEQIAQMSMIVRLIFVFALDRGKFGAQNQQRPKERERANDEIRLHHAQRFESKVRLVRAVRLMNSHFPRCQLNPGKNKNRANQSSTDGSQRIERLREVQPPFRTMWIAQLSDERIRCRLQERKHAGNNEQCEKKESITSGQRGRPEQE